MKKVKFGIVMCMALVVTVVLMSATAVQACEKEDVGMAVGFEELKADECTATVLDRDATVLEAKETLASLLNEGVSPEEIFLLRESPYDSCNKELLEDDAKLSKCIKDGDTLYYVISSLAMGEYFEIGGEEMRVSHIKYDLDDERFYYSFDVM